jgi:hypothetical protein
MNNKSIATFLLLSFLSIFLGLVAGDFEDMFYGIGALGTLIFGGLSLSRLHRINKKSWFPYFAGVVMFVFWSLSFIAPEGIGLLAPIYFITLVFAAISLFSVSDHQIAI